MVNGMENNCVRECYIIYNTYVKCMVGNNYPDIQLMNKSGTTWEFEVYNNTEITNKSSIFYYNSKMCFESDAKKWSSKHSNINTISVDQHWLKPFTLKKIGLLQM